MKKGEISINVVVMAAIAMLVLVILTVFVFRSSDGLSRATTCNDGLGQNIMVQCVDNTDAGRQSCRAQNGLIHPTAACPESNQRCCMIPDSSS